MHDGHGYWFEGISVRRSGKVNISRAAADDSDGQIRPQRRRRRQRRGEGGVGRPG